VKTRVTCIVYALPASHKRQLIDELKLVEYISTSADLCSNHNGGLFTITTQ